MEVQGKDRALAAAGICFALLSLMALSVELNLQIGLFGEAAAMEGDAQDSQKLLEHMASAMGDVAWIQRLASLSGLAFAGAACMVNRKKWFILILAFTFLVFLAGFSRHFI